MCIIFLASHNTCVHTQFIGTYRCGVDCSVEARHTFKLDSSSVQCETCLLLSGEDLDPEHVAAQFQPATQGHSTIWFVNGQQVGPPPEVAKEEDKAEVEVGEKPATGRQRLYKSLDSDPDDWKLRNLEPVPRELSEVKLVQADGLENNAGAGEDFQPSPEGLKKHRQLVQEQLQQLPKEIGSATTLAADEGLTSLESTFGRRLAPEAPEFVPGAAITPAGQEDYNTMAGMPPLEEDPWAPCYRAREF